MKKGVRNVLLIFLVAIVLYAAFVIIDSIRLRQSKLYSKPFITVCETEDEHSITYNGLGYAVKYNRYTTEEMDTEEQIVNVELGEGAEFQWFGITIWSWEW